jgi:hypothetical protein
MGYYAAITHASRRRPRCPFRGTLTVGVQNDDVHPATAVQTGPLPPASKCGWAAGYPSVHVALQNFGCWHVYAAEQERPEESVFALAASMAHVHERVCRFIACSRRIRVIRACAEGIANASNPKVTRELRSHKVRRTPSHITALVSREKGNPEDVMRSQPCRAIRLRVQRCNSACKRCNLRALRDIFPACPFCGDHGSKNTKPLFCFRKNHEPSRSGALSSVHCI